MPGHQVTSISAVIPTFRRPELICRAVRSALEQSRPPEEIIVVVDGRDPATIDALQSLHDPRIRPIMPDQHLGNAAARNRGVSEARSEWIAFLDDDDQWLPEKLRTQIATAEQMANPYPVIACRMIARTGKADLIWPRRFPRAGEVLSEYLCRRSLPLAGEGLLQSSMILTRRELLRRTPFDDNLRRHVDADWFLRVVHERGVEIRFPATTEPLAIWHIEQGRPRVSTGGAWSDSLQWGRDRRHLFTRRAYAGFICKNVSALAAASQQPRLFQQLWSEARRHGRPSWVDLASHVMNFTLKPGVRDRIWRLVRFARHGSGRQGTRLP